MTYNVLVKIFGRSLSVCMRSKCPGREVFQVDESGYARVTGKVRMKRSKKNSISVPKGIRGKKQG